MKRGPGSDEQEMATIINILTMVNMSQLKLLIGTK